VSVLETRQKPVPELDRFRITQVMLIPTLVYGRQCRGLGIEP
jgi:hypothetical protein